MTINEWLQTNGGDVLIVADEVVINAPIDTRVRFRMGPNYWVANSGPIFTTDWQSLEDILEFSPAHQHAYDALYLWRETYDPNKKKFVYGVGPRPTPGKFTDFAQLPSAQVPLARIVPTGPYHGANPSNGEDAPDADVIWENVRSGNIIIYATQIRLCEACKKALSLPPQSSFSQPSDPFDVEKAIFLQTSGLKGGRGGAGSLSYCPSRYDPSDAKSCELLRTKPGGLSGRPVRGGDAGSIGLFFVNRRPTLDEIALLQIASQVDGGYPAHTYRQRTSSYARGIVWWKDRGAFQNEGAEIGHPQLRGKSGSLNYLTEIDSDTAVRDISSRLLTAEFGRNYSLDLLLKQAASDPDVFSSSPADTLRSFFSTQELIRMQQEVWYGFSYPGATQEYPAPAQLSSFFSTLSCVSENYGGLVAEHQEYLQRLCELRSYKPPGYLREDPKIINVSDRRVVPHSPY